MTAVRPRFIPCLLLHGRSLVKTRRFADKCYIGDPTNTVRIYDEMEVDELCLLDITATPTGRGPQFELIGDIASECFMPLSYGGGIAHVDQAARIFALGAEKVCINSASLATDLLSKIATKFGNQSVVAAIDARQTSERSWEVMTHGGRIKTGRDVVSWAREAVSRGAGEILLTSIDRDGTMSGYDLPLVRAVVAAVDVPVIACGGARTLDDFSRVVNEAGAQAAAAGSMVFYQNVNRSVLVNYPTKGELRNALSAKIEDRA